MEFQDWGLIDYQQALLQQENLVEQTAQNNSPGTLIFCTHPPIVTLGSKTQEGDVFAWDGPTHKITRGGRATYHGPSQLVIYPIVNLNSENSQRRPRDLAWYLKTLETSIIEALALYGVAAIGKSLEKSSGEETGIWVGSNKIASLGIGVRKWITFHGAAINLDEDDRAFLGMNPCGFKREIMTNLEKIVGHKVGRQEFSDRLKKILMQKL